MRPKPGMFGAIRNGVLLSESLEADLCFKPPNLVVICLESADKDMEIQCCLLE